MDVNRITELFGVYGVVSIEKLKDGHINETYIVECKTERYILQSINRNVFEKPETIMRNISFIEDVFVSEHRVVVPRFMKCSGRNYARYDGKIWRFYEYIGSWDNYPNKEYIHGFAVGTFMRVVNSGDFKFRNTISGFHDFGDGMEIFKSLMPMRNIHGDTKASNIIYSERPAVIDLDTAMYSFAMVDYGDMIRSITAGGVDLNAVRRATKGFADGLEGMLTGAEVNSLYYGIILVIRELFRRYSNEHGFPNMTSEQCSKRAEQLIVQLGYIRKNENAIVKIINECFE
ncbi:MAG: phosphotransferase [Ruminococcus sp.]|nr:phosphotransferase [Ruminococcus sp.]MDE6784154.1 phosphotransferase [Ruminococcus sp.]